MAKITLSDGTILEGTVKELTQYAEMAAELIKKIGSEQESSTDELITHEGAEYKLVDRKAQPGDVVYVTKDAKGTRDIPNESFYLVEVDVKIGERWRNDVYKKHHNRTTDTVKVYEPVAQPLKVGDYAKVVGNSNMFDEEGAIVKIVEDDGTYIPFKNEHLDGSYAGWQDVESLVRATDEEVAEAKAQADLNKFSVGDKVRLTSGGGEIPLAGYSDGEIYEVSNIGVMNFGKKRIEITGGRYSTAYALPNQLEKVSAEEVKAEQKRKELEAKWEKIGRKPNKFKEGDIVRVIDRLGAMGLYVGFITEIVALREGSSPLVLGSNGINYHAKVELITPVESRFDRA